MLSSRQKSYVIKKFQQHGDDTGSAEVQVGLLSRKIDELSKHLQDHPKDNHSRRGLLKMVSKRRRLLSYLKNNNHKRYKRIIKDLGLKK